MNSPKGAVLEQEKPQRDSVSSGPPPSGTLNQVDDWEYVTGFKFLMVMIVIVLACFTMLLDTSIIVTVSFIDKPSIIMLIKDRPFLE